MRVIITGGTGQIGRPLIADLLKQGYEVVVLSRSPGVIEGLPKDVIIEGWDARTAKGWGHLADGAGAIVNLAGENIAGEGFLPAKWTDERKKRIIDSRVNAGKAVAEAVEQAAKKPGVVIQASAVGYYGPRGSEEITEDTPPGSDFLAKVCLDWEASSASVEKLGVRRAVIRTGIPLSFEEGALSRMALPFKLFAGGPLGSGKQQFPWIHPADETGAIRFLIENSNASGAFNLTAPNPLSNAEFSRVLGKVMGRPSFVPAPAFAFEMAFGEAASLVLTGQRAVPKRLLEAGYKFQFTDAEAALRDIYR
jgi:uncharacterized protein